jgi:hypothetical protein
LFWRKKPLIDLEIPDEESSDHRQAYRTMPDPERPIILTLGGSSYTLTNISGTGCCFRSHNYSEGFRASGVLKIPSDDVIFPVTVNVVSKTKDICHCKFEKISDKSMDAIHAYVLEVQKSMLRNR